MSSRATDQQVVRWRAPGWAYGILGGILLLIVGVGSWFVQREGRLQAHKAEEALETIAQLKVDQIAAWRAERMLDAALVMKNPFLHRAIAHYLVQHGEPVSQAQTEFLIHFEAFQQHGYYRDVLLVDGSGKVLLSLTRSADRLHAEAASSLADSLKERHPILTDLHAGPGPLPAHVDVIAPLDLALSEAAGQQAAVVLQMGAADYLFPLIQSWPGVSRSGETLLVRRERDAVVFLNELRHQPGTALRLRIPQTATHIPAVMAILGREGFFEGVDYRGVEVFSVLRRIPDSPWFLVAKLDRAEAMADARLNAGLIIGTTLAFLLVVLIAGMAIWNRGMTGALRARLGAERALQAEKTFSDSLFEASFDTVFLFDPATGRAVRWNRRFQEVTGYRDEEIAARRFPDAYFGPADLPAATQAVAEVLSRGRATVELSLITQTGQAISYEYVETRVQQEAGVDLILSIGRDIHQRKEMEAESRRANEQLAAAVGRLQEKNRQGRIIGELRQFLQACSNLGEIGPVLAHSMPKLFPDSGGALFLLHASRADLESTAGWGAFPEALEANLFAPDQCWGLRRGSNYLLDDPEHGLRCPHLHAAPAAPCVCIPLMAKGDVLGLLHLFRPAGVGQDPKALAASLDELATPLSELLSLSISNIRLRELLSLQAVRDPLTGMYNRRFMEDSLNRELVRAARKGAPIGIIMADIDHFKQFNDVFGHAAGDLLLAEIARLLAGRLRGGDIACRYGGEEFVLILPECTYERTLARASELTEEVRLLKLAHQGQLLGQITVSMGVAAFPGHGETPEELLRLADAALYQAKQQGRNRVVGAGRS